VPYFKPYFVHSLPKMKSSRIATEPDVYKNMYLFHYSHRMQTQKSFHLHSGLAARYFVWLGVECYQ